MSVRGTKRRKCEGAEEWVLVESPVAKFAIHEEVAIAACSTDCPASTPIDADFRLQFEN